MSAIIRGSKSDVKAKQAKTRDKAVSNILTSAIKDQRANTKQPTPNAIGELKAFVAVYKPVLNFVPFVPEDNALGEQGGIDRDSSLPSLPSFDSSLAVSTNLTSLRLLLRCNYLVFLAEVCITIIDKIYIHYTIIDTMYHNNRHNYTD
jgi:hypothetical protein